MSCGFSSGRPKAPLYGVRSAEADDEDEIDGATFPAVGSVCLYVSGVCGPCACESAGLLVTAGEQQARNEKGAGPG